MPGMEDLHNRTVPRGAALFFYSVYALAALGFLIVGFKRSGLDHALQLAISVAMLLTSLTWVAKTIRSRLPVAGCILGMRVMFLMLLLALHG